MGRKNRSGRSTTRHRRGGQQKFRKSRAPSGPVSAISPTLDERISSHAALDLDELGAADTFSQHGSLMANSTRVMTRSQSRGRSLSREADAESEEYRGGLLRGEPPRKRRAVRFDGKSRTDGSAGSGAGGGSGSGGEDGSGYDSDSESSLSENARNRAQLSEIADGLRERADSASGLLRSVLYAKACVAMLEVCEHFDKDDPERVRELDRVANHAAQCASTAYKLAQNPPPPNMPRRVATATVCTLRLLASLIMRLASVAKARSFAAQRQEQIRLQKALAKRKGNFPGDTHSDVAKFVDGMGGLLLAMEFNSKSNAYYRDAQPKHGTGSSSTTFRFKPLGDWLHTSVPVFSEYCAAELERVEQLHEQNAGEKIGGVV